MTAPTPNYQTLGAGAPLALLPGLGGRTGAPPRLAGWLEHQSMTPFAANRAVWNIQPPVGLLPGTTLQEVADDYAATLRALFDRPVDIVGVSTGGSIALLLAAHHPHLVRRLVLVSAAHRLSDQGRAVQRKIALLLRNDRPRRAAGLFLGNTGATAPSRAILHAAGMLAPRIVVGSRDPDLLVLLDAEDEFDLLTELAGIRARTLVLGGAHDRFYSAAMFGTTAAALPDAKLELDPRGGHLGIIGNRSLAIRILRFLDEDATRGSIPE